MTTTTTFDPDRDVLLGRGAHGNHNVGNMWYRDLVAGYLDTYVNAPMTGKDDIAKAMVSFVLDVRRGNFMRKIENTDQWKIVDFKEAVRSVKQCFRDTHRKQLKAAVRAERQRQAQGVGRVVSAGEQQYDGSLDNHVFDETIPWAVAEPIPDEENPDRDDGTNHQNEATSNEQAICANNSSEEDGRNNNSGGDGTNQDGDIDAVDNGVLTWERVVEHCDKIIFGENDTELEEF